MTNRPGAAGWWPVALGQPSLPLLLTALLLCLGLANVVILATGPRAEDGVYWVDGPDGVTAAAFAPGLSVDTGELRVGDVLLAIDDRPIQRLDDVQATLRATERGAALRYTVLRLGTRDVVDARLTPFWPRTGGTLYFVLAAVGTLTLFVGVGARLRRPRDPATLHFFWLAAAFFTLFAFSFSGRLDRLDWVFYWGDAAAMLLLPPLFLHFTLVFPQRPRPWTAGGRWRLALLYVPAMALGLARVGVIAWGTIEASRVVDLLVAIERLEFAYLVACFAVGFVVLLRGLAGVATITARRQLRWIAWGTALGAGPFALGYALPWAIGREPSLLMELTAVPLALIPLAFASAIVRYRLLDVEVIVKRVLVYVAALTAVIGIFALLLEAIQRLFLRDSLASPWGIALLAMVVAVLLAPPVKAVVQTLLDRAFYRDRYDYRRALVGFARDLNSDLDLHRLSGRIVSRVVETLLVDRMALMLADEASPWFGSVRAAGFGDRHPPALSARSAIGARLADGHFVALDDPMAVGRFPVEEIEFWRDAGLYYFVPCMATDGTIAVLAIGRKDTGDPLHSEDTALLVAVAGQMATALENARLYRQLQLKALELDRLHTFNENILESLHDGLLVTDLRDRVVRWNGAIGQLHGVAPAEAVGRPLAELFDAPFVEAIRAARRDQPEGAVLARMPLQARTGVRGDARIVDVAVLPLRAFDGAAGSTAGTIVLIEDVTSRVQLEEQLQISEKMASIGLLAAGVAHEVNTPLTGISSFTQMLLEGADPADPRTQLLEKIERQTFRAARIVNGLLNLSRPSSQAASDRGPVDLNAVVADVLSLLEHQFESHRIRVRRELADGPAVVWGAEHKLQQVFLNLFLNAKDAMPRGGWLTVRTQVEGTHVSAEVADTGSGIPSEYLARIYDPFFTTKASGRGTGLGLSITYGIVREHEGSIECESELGQGTRFALTLPAAAPARPVVAARAT